MRNRALAIIFIAGMVIWFIFVLLILHVMPVGHGFEDYFLMPGGAISLRADPHSWCMFLFPTQLMQLAQKISSPGDDYLVVHALAFSLISVMAWRPLSLRYGKHAVLFLLLATPMSLLPTLDTNAYGKLLSFSYNCSYNRFLDLVTYYSFLISVRIQAGRGFKSDALWFAFALGCATLTKPTYLPELGLLMIFSQAEQRNLRFWGFCSLTFLAWIVPELWLEPGYPLSILSAAESRHQALHHALVHSLQQGIVFLIVLVIILRQAREYSLSTYKAMVIPFIYLTCEPFIVEGNTGDMANLRFTGAGLALIFLFRETPLFNTIKKTQFRFFTEGYGFKLLLGGIALYPLRFLLYTSFRLLFLVLSMNLVHTSSAELIQFKHFPGFGIPAKFLDSDFLSLEHDLPARTILMKNSNGKTEITLNYMMLHDLDILIDRHPSLLQTHVLIPSFASSILVYAHPQTRPATMLSSYSPEVPKSLAVLSIEQSQLQAQYILLNYCESIPFHSWSQSWVTKDQEGCWGLLGRNSEQ